MFKVPSQLALSQWDDAAGSFMEDLQRFLASIGQKIPNLNPQLNGQPLHLSLLYQNVINRGGWQKVNQQSAWEKVAYSVGIPKPCANAGHALKALYHQYLLKYECSKFNRTLAEEYPDDDDIFKRSTFNGPGFPRVPDYLRVSYGLSIDLRDEDSMEKLTLSLSSGLPNETDFAINLLLMRSADLRKPFVLTNGHVALLEALMASSGLFSNHSGHFVGIYNSFRKDSGKDFIRFWKDTVMDQSFLEWLRVDGNEQPDSDCPDSTNLFCQLQPLDSTELRIKQIATILYNLASEEPNASFLADQESCLKFAFLCAKCSKATVLELGLDIIIAVVSKIDLTMCDPWVLPALIGVMRSCISSPDRLGVSQGLMLITKICDMEKNADTVIDALEDVDYLRLSQYLIVPDTYLIIFSLEALYKLSGLGEHQSTSIAEIPDAIGILIRLVTVAIETVVMVDSCDTAPVLSTSVIVQPTTMVPPMPNMTPTSVLSSEEVEATVGWLNRTFEVEEAFAMTMTDVFRDYVLFCASSKRFIASPQSLAHCLRIAFPQGRTTNLNVGGKVQMCLLGLKKRGDSLASVLPGHVTSESQDQPQVGRHIGPMLSGNSVSASSHPSPVLHSLISSSDSSAPPTKIPVTQNGLQPNDSKCTKGIESSSLIRSLLATKINRKHSTSSTDPQGAPMTNCNGFDEDTNTMGFGSSENPLSDSESRDCVASIQNTSTPAFSVIAPSPKKPRRKKAEKTEKMKSLNHTIATNGMANGGSHLFSDDSHSSASTPLPVPYVIDDAIKPKKPRGRPRVNGIAKIPMVVPESNGNDGISPTVVAKAPKTRRSSRKPKATTTEEPEINGHANIDSLPEHITEPAKKRRKSAKRKSAGESDETSMSSLSAQPGSSVTAAGSLSRHASPSGLGDMLDYLCEWEGCNRSFADTSAVFKHNYIDHVPSATEGICKWPNCNGIKRQTLSLITHLNESHCSQGELHRQSMRRRDIKRGIASLIPPPAAQPLPNYSEHAALHSIQARYGSAVASDFAPEPESQSTKTTRLTAALIIRNIAHFSHVGRIKLECHEYNLTTCAMQISEAAQVINECLFYMAVHRRTDGHS